MNRFFIILLSLIFLFLSASCAKNQNSEIQAQAPVSESDASASAQAPLTTSEENAPFASSVQTETDSSDSNGVESADNINAEIPTDELTLPPSKGTMYFTDASDNKFIKAVADAYGVDTALLAAIYMVPASDSNCVWQFDGSKAADGSILRTPETLKYVYVVSADAETICRTGGKDGNIGMTTAEGYFTFKTSKNIIMPKFSEALSGNSN